MKKFLNDIGITKSGYYDGDTYIIDLDDDSEFSKMFSIIDKCEYLEPDDDNTYMTIVYSKIGYIGDKYSILLTADFEKDEYKIIVDEIK